jgi:hypothetical protein
MLRVAFIPRLMSDEHPRSGAEQRPPRNDAPHDAADESCDVCGSTDLWWRNCKLLCRNCQAIVKSCSDL